jgi:DNA-directed RNA polymerase subunit RPC12/RpoP
MTSEITSRWIAAGKILSEDAAARVLCPVCQSRILEISDVHNESKPEELERHMSCSACGARNSLRLVRPV